MAPDYSVTAPAPVLWFHADSQAAMAKLVALWDGLLRQMPGLALVLSFPANLTVPVMDVGCVLVPIRSGRIGGLARVLAPLRPRVGLIAMRSVPTSFVRMAQDMDCPLMLVEADYPRVSGLWGRIPGIARRTLRKLAKVFVPSADHARVWTQAGLMAERVMVCGVLNDAPRAMPCNEAERDALSDALRQRSVWLAAAVPEAEEGIVIAALRETLRESHRLVLLLHPADPARGPALRAELAERFTTALRSVDEPITTETQVYIVDTEEERGLWYRLAVACYLGGSLSRTGASLSPFEAAGLGCAIVHGREVGRHAEAFARLADAQATRRILRADALGRTMCAVLRPEAAAALANRAWEVVSDGAEASEAITAALLFYVRATDARA
jgi:3-deoxy-D-manno-octulosonic-acid transferase